VILAIYIKEDEIDATCSTHGQIRNFSNILFGTRDGKGSLGRPRCRWGDNTKMNLKVNRIRECGLEDRVQWQAFMNALMNLWAHNMQGIS